MQITDHTAPAILKEATDTLAARAKSRDSEEKGERSMKASVDAFNALYGTNLTEEQGWMFMVLLKASRARNGETHRDDYVDGSAYFALAGEAALKV